MNLLLAEVAWHSSLGEKAWGALVVAAQHHEHENANRKNRNGFLHQHIEAMKEAVEHQVVHPGKTDGDGYHGQNTSPEILLPAQNLNLWHYAYQTASAEVASF